MSHPTILSPCLNSRELEKIHSFSLTPTPHSYQRLSPGLSEQFSILWKPLDDDFPLLVAHKSWCTLLTLLNATLSDTSPVIIQGPLWGWERRTNRRGRWWCVALGYSFGEPQPGRAEARQCPHTSPDEHECEVGLPGWRWDSGHSTVTSQVPWPSSVISIVSCMFLSSMALHTTSTSPPHGDHCFVVGLALQFLQEEPPSGSLTSEPELAGDGLLTALWDVLECFVVGLWLLPPGLLQTCFFLSSLVGPQLPTCFVFTYLLLTSPVPWCTAL